MTRFPIAKASFSLFAAFFIIVAAAKAQPLEPPIREQVIEGDMSGIDHQTYRELPFDVPAGVTHLTVEFSYTGREDKSTLDLGLRDPHGFRGWSGGNKSVFTVGLTDSTPSYLAGAMPIGTWHLIIGVPNMRPQATSHYTAKISFTYAGDPLPESQFVAKPLSDEARWYRGDLHAHSGHSDGTCDSLGGKRVPCPVFVTLETAKARGLDFLALTEHNAISHHEDLRGLQPYFDTLLLIPGREITTFYGHTNVFGTLDDLPFQLGTQALPSINDLSTKVHAKGALLSINHPTVPSGESCMGCGWVAKDTDWSQIDAIEVINGGSYQAQGQRVDGPLDSIPYWEAKLNEGFKITAIAGSDSHDPKAPLSRQVPVGFPTTVIFAQNLSQAALLEGLKKGRVFIDLGEPAARILDFTATAQNKSARMGETLAVSAKGRVTIEAEVKGAKDALLDVIADGHVVMTLPITADDQRLSIRLDPKTYKKWIRLNVRLSDGKLLMMSNPVYIEHRH